MSSVENAPFDPALIVARAGRVDLIGRQAELHAIQREIEAVHGGEPRVLMLAGEAGIGKSRLLDEARRLMTEAGGTVAVGRCVDERGMPAYFPWILALAELSQRFDPLTPNPRDLLLAPSESAASAGASPEQLRLRLFDAVARGLDYIAGQTPLLLIFDDLQWSDEASNALLRYVAVQVSNARLLIMGAYRQEELTTNVNLARTVEELDRRRVLHTMKVPALSEHDSEQLVEGLVGARLPNLAASIHRHGEGNPFFIEEVVRSLAEEGQLQPAEAAASSLPVPAGVSAVIQRRLGRVSRDCREVLDYAALAGRDIAVDLIAEAAQRGQDNVAILLDEAAEAALVRPVGPAEAAQRSPVGEIDFVFTHDRIRETIDAGINPVRRRTIHARLAAALEAHAATDPTVLAALTHHYRHARMPEQARHYSVILGEASMRSHAHGDAIRAFKLAIELSDQRSSNDLGDLWLKLGDAALAAGSPEAVDAFASAKQAFDSGDNQAGGASALFRLGVAHARREEFDVAVSCLEAAGTTMERLDADLAGDAREHARSLVELGNILGTSLADYERGIASGRRALDLAQQVPDDPSLEAEARLALARTLMRCCRLEEGHELLTPALPLALGAGNFDLASEIAGVLANHAYWIGDVAASERLGLRRRDLAAQAGDPYARRHSRPWLATVALAQGNWEATARMIAEAEPDVAHVDSPEPRAFLQCLTGMMNFQRGDLSEAIANYEAAIAAFRQSGAGTLAWYHGMLTHAQFVAGDLAAAERTGEETARIVMSLPALAMPRAPSLAQLAFVAIRSNDLPAIRRWYAELRPFTGQHHWVLIDRALAMLAAALGDHKAAESYLSAALETSTRGGIGPERALTLVELAKLSLGTNPSEAAAKLSEAVDLLQRFEMRLALAEASQLLDSFNGARSARYPHSLTEREVAVLALVAQGLTNREIGDRLGISDKTVTNHLTHIFTKANLDNRSAAVAFAMREGLA